MIGITTRLMLTLMLGATPALAGNDCAVPMTDWQPREAVMTLAATLGWEVRRIRIDDGCYELIGQDADGRAIEVKLNPATLAVIEMEFEADHPDDQEAGSDGHSD